MRIYYKTTYTYILLRLFLQEVSKLFNSVKRIISYAVEFFRGLKQYNTQFGEVIEQCSRFGVSSLPITFSIVGMTSIIVSMQVAGEMVKQGGGNFIGMLMAILTVREEGAIMAGFAIISMIGSSLASEIATMKVTEQIDAIKVLSVNPVHYLFTPRIIAGTVMMPMVVLVAAVFGIVCGAFAANITSGLSLKAYFDSVWSGLKLHDLNVCVIKSICFGFTIALVCCSCGMEAKDGAKGVGQATTKAVVWSFVAIVLIDLVFAATCFY